MTKPIFTRLPAALYCCWLPVLLVLCIPASIASAWETVEFRESPGVIEPEISYISQAPKIDGILDEDLRFLPERHFNSVHKDNADNPEVASSFRLAYGAHFLYVYLEAEAEAMTYRDRAYQNGDGFTVVLTVPRPDNAPTEEFYVLACSAVDRERMEWTRRIFWYYNVDNIFIRPDDGTKMEFHDGDGVISFELVLPWSDVHPYHPWFGDGIGFNMGFAKAIGSEGLNFYRVVNATIGAENSPREYALLKFQAPEHEGDPQVFVLPDKNHIARGSACGARAVTVVSEPFAEDLRVLVKSGERETIAWEPVGYECAPPLAYHEFTIDTADLPAGGYTLEWYSRKHDSKGETGLSVLPRFDLESMGRRLDGLDGVLSPGTFTTFRFLMREISEELEAVYPYETCTKQRFGLARLIDALAEAETGEDVFARRRGFVRMAYRSEVDETYQPYIVWIPEDYDPAKSYPLLVYLHGSASDERTIMGFREGLPDGFIALGPRGRTPSNAWSWDNAQEDVAESIQSVIDNLSIDEGNIFLAGFSMGGYGVYRTFYETPGTYRGIAVFSGHPDIANLYSDTDSHPNFTKEEYLKPFDGTPVFIFHGRRDRNVPFENTEALIGKLEKAGAEVEFHVEDDKGHESPDKETVEAFHQWIEKVMKR